MPPEEIGANLPQLALISRAIGQVYKLKLGRGPHHVRCFYAGPDAIVCFLEGTLTPIERLLTTIEEHRHLRDLRVLVQDAARPELCRIVEGMTGRDVVASTSGFDTRADVASENFRLGPVHRTGTAP
jgi:uncharacterized protein YbcI